MANDSSTLPATSPKFKLSVMMFLQFFIGGCWLRGFVRTQLS